MEIQKTFVFAWKSTYTAIAVISSGVSQRISAKFGMADLLGAEGVVVQPEFDNSDWLPWKIWIAGFKASLD